MTEARPFLNDCRPLFQQSLRRGQISGKQGIHRCLKSWIWWFRPLRFRNGPVTESVLLSNGFTSITQGHFMVHDVINRTANPFRVPTGQARGHCPFARLVPDWCASAIRRACRSSWSVAHGKLLKLVREQVPVKSYHLFDLRVDIHFCPITSNGCHQYSLPSGSPRRMTLVA